MPNNGMHPLLNRVDSVHYDGDGKPAIFEMEEYLSVREMIGFCAGSIFKYKARQGRKGQDEADARKIGTYVAYQEELIKLIRLGINDQISVEYAWKQANIQWRY